MLFTTPIAISHSDREISYQNKILSIGSCFADNLTKLLRTAFFQIESNPFGVLYNPASIAHCLQLLQQTYDTSPSHVAATIPIVEHSGLFHSMLHHGSFSSPSKEDVMEHITQSLEQGARFLSQADILILTFGSAWVYEYKGQVAGNCHKLPSSSFRRRCLSVEEIVATYNQLTMLPLLNNKRIIFTVSPIRHLKDGLHANQLSKSILLLAIDHLTEHLSDTNTQPLKETPQTLWEYFPSYEIILDELRDYRFYADDMVHPSEKAIEYVGTRFAETYFSSQTVDTMKQLKKLYNNLQHRPLHPDTDEYRKFSEYVSQQLNIWQTKFPWINYP